MMAGPSAAQFTVVSASVRKSLDDKTLRLSRHAVFDYDPPARSFASPSSPSLAAGSRGNEVVAKGTEGRREREKRRQSRIFLKILLFARDIDDL